MIITVSGIPGAGSTTAARGLAEKLKHKVLTVGEIYKMYAEKSGVPRQEIHKMWEIHSQKPEEEERFHRALDEEVRRVCEEKKNLIVNGKLAGFQLKNADFRVLLIAPLEVRAKRTAQRDKMSIDAARASIEEREMYERMEWKRMYNFDYARDIDIYDLVLNTANLGAEQEIEAIYAVLKIKKKI